METFTQGEGITHDPSNAHETARTTATTIIFKKWRRGTPGRQEELETGARIPTGPDRRAHAKTTTLDIRGSVIEAQMTACGHVRSTDADASPG